MKTHAFSPSPETHLPLRDLGVLVISWIGMLHQILYAVPAAIDWHPPRGFVHSESPAIDLDIHRTPAQRSTHLHAAR